MVGSFVIPCEVGGLEVAYDSVLEREKLECGGLLKEYEGRADIAVCAWLV